MKAVFIGGCGRSGTTLLGAMLGAHSSCLCTPESQFKAEVYKELSTAGDKALDVPAAMDRIKNHWRFKIWDLDLGADPPQEINSYAGLIEWIVRRYGQGVGKPGPDIWVDHTPGNRKYAEVLFDLFPGSKMIHIVRDGRAVAASIMPLDWGANTIDRAAHFWQARVSQGLAAESLSKERVIRVKYEELVRKPEETLKKLCSFVGLDFQQEMIKGAGYKVPQYTRKQHSLIGRNPDGERATAWENSLTPRQVEIFESIAGEMLSTLGYSLRYGAGARKATKSERLLLDIENYCRKKINGYRKKSRRRKTGLNVTKPEA